MKPKPIKIENQRPESVQQSLTSIPQKDDGTDDEEAKRGNYNSDSSSIDPDQLAEIGSISDDGDDKKMRHIEKEIEEERLKASPPKTEIMV